jgi:hypothetical protein
MYLGGDMVNCKSIRLENGEIIQDVTINENKYITGFLELWTHNRRRLINKDFIIEIVPDDGQ